MSKEAMKLAFEVLQECRRDPRLKYEHPTYDKAIKALEEALAKQEQDEPVVGTKTWFEDGKVVTQNLYYSDVYTTPQQRKPLTDEQIDALKPFADGYRSRYFARAIEAAHGIKE
jgi:hypothetical protein